MKMKGGLGWIRNELARLVMGTIFIVISGTIKRELNQLTLDHRKKLQIYELKQTSP